MRPFLLHTNLRVLRRSKPMVGMLAFAVVIILGMRRRPPYPRHRRGSKWRDSAWRDSDHQDVQRGISRTLTVDEAGEYEPVAAAPATPQH
jgi:hypothetical protein